MSTLQRPNPEGLKNRGYNQLQLMKGHTAIDRLASVCSMSLLRESSI